MSSEIGGMVLFNFAFDVFMFEIMILPQTTRILNVFIDSLLCSVSPVVLKDPQNVCVRSLIDRPFRLLSEPTQLAYLSIIHLGTLTYL